MPNLTGYVWKAQFKQGATWYNLPDVQTVDIFRGRRLQIDDYGIDTANLMTRNPSGWTTAPKLGDQITVYIYAPGFVVGQDNFVMFVGRIRNVAITYGKVAAEDEVSVSCEGIQGDWGRAPLVNFSLPAQLTDESILDIGTEVGLSTAQFFGRSTNSAITFTGNALDLVNQITRTEEARMFGAATSITATPQLWWYGRNSANASTYYFTDGTATSNTAAQKFDQIEFRSSADNYYNEVVVQPVGLAAQTATLNQTPVYGLSKDTRDNTTAQASDHATWLLNNFQNKNQAIAAISFTEIEQSTTIGTGAANGQPLILATDPINTKFAIVFRGSTYYTIGEGIQISARPGQTRFTIFMSGQDQNAYLVLNDSIYGKLDSNKLGF
jgi:hypothetical protein